MPTEVRHCELTCVFLAGSRVGRSTGRSPRHRGRSLTILGHVRVRGVGAFGQQARLGEKMPSSPRVARRKRNARSVRLSGHCLWGVDGGGKGDVVSLLLEWMDPAFTSTRWATQPTRWPAADVALLARASPKGKTGVFFARGTGDRRPGVRRSGRGLTELAEISHFGGCSSTGALVVKLWCTCRRGPAQALQAPRGPIRRPRGGQ
jgi:hypothetical protein